MKRAVVVILFVAFIVASFFAGRLSIRPPEAQIVEMHDTTTIIITVRDTVREVITRTFVRVDTVRLATADTTARDDSANVELPIEQITVKGEHYTAVIEGFRPALVDIQLDLPTQYITTTKTETVRKRWSFVVGPQVGAGYGVGGFTPYVGVGFTFGYCF